MKKPLHLETQIKIKLPNNYFIEINFGVREKLKVLFDLLSQILLHDQYYFFIPPFVNKKIDIRNGSETFEQLNMVPDATLNLLFYNEELNKQDAVLLRH